MAKVRCWITEILKVGDMKIIDEVIGKKYNFIIYREGSEPIERLGRDYSTFEEEFETAVFENNIKPRDISNSPPLDYKSSKPFERQRPLEDDDLE